MKYKLTNNTKRVLGRTLHQIEATASFGDVIKGDLGGWIEKEENLSQENNAWVYGNAWVADNAEVYDNARVSGNAQVFGDAEVFGELKITSGLFFGVKLKSEKLTTLELPYGYELIGRGDVKTGGEDVELSDEELIAELERRGKVSEGKIINE